MDQPIVMKFGGTSVANAERIHQVAKLVAKDPTHKRVVVVSAMAGITDLLIGMTEQAVTGDMSAYDELCQRHMTAIKELDLGASATHDLTAQIDSLLTDLRDTLKKIQRDKACSPRLYDAVVSFGERLSIRLVSAALAANGENARPVEATQLIVTTDQFGDAEPLLDASRIATKKVLKPLLVADIVPVVTGFIGATVNHETTTLGRGASDYTSTILGYCLDARAVWIWTDVTGVMTADPRIIPEARTIDRLSYNEAAELSYFGAKVLHPLTMVPVSLKNIPIFIKNTFEPDAKGTEISARGSHATGSVKAVTRKEGLAQITVRGKGISGVPLVAAKVFECLASGDIDIYLISQASSEHNISLVVGESHGEKAVEAIRTTLGSELSKHSIDEVQLQPAVAIVAVVGDGMHGSPGVTGTTFSALGAGGIDVTAIAQGSSERNLSFVVNEPQAVIAVRCLHQAFQLVEATSKQRFGVSLLKRIRR